MGSFAADRAFWGRPELMAMVRPAAVVNAAGAPGTDLLASTAAALAAAGMALAADDLAYSTHLIVTAQQLYGCVPGVSLMWRGQGPVKGNGGG